jgi:hypothetical protein
MEHASKYLQWVELLLFYHHAEPASTPIVSESHYGQRQSGFRRRAS